MNPKPDDLLKLWARRDTALSSGQDDQVLLVYKDGDEPGATRSHARPTLPHLVPEPKQDQKLPNVTLFPTIKITPQSINLATHHVPPQR